MIFSSEKNNMISSNNQKIYVMKECPTEENKFNIINHELKINENVEMNIKIPHNIIKETIINMGKPISSLAWAYRGRRLYTCIFY